MSGDTTYTQQMHELEEIRRDAEEEVNERPPQADGEPAGCPDEPRPGQGHAVGGRGDRRRAAGPGEGRAADPRRDRCRYQRAEASVTAASRKPSTTPRSTSRPTASSTRTRRTVMPRRHRRRPPRWRRGRQPVTVRPVQLSGRQARQFAREYARLATAQPATANGALAASGAWRFRRHLVPFAWLAVTLAAAVILRVTPRPVPYAVIAAAAAGGAAGVGDTAPVPVRPPRRRAGRGCHPGVAARPDRRRVRPPGARAAGCHVGAVHRGVGASLRLAPA